MFSGRKHLLTAERLHENATHFAETKNGDTWLVFRTCFHFLLCGIRRVPVVVDCNVRNRQARIAARKFAAWHAHTALASSPCFSASAA